DEVRVVGADGNALVAGETIKQRQSRAHLLWRRGILGGGVSWIGQHLLDIAFGVEEAGGRDPGGERLARSRAQVFALRQGGAAGTRPLRRQREAVERHLRMAVSFDDELVDV